MSACLENENKHTVSVVKVMGFNISYSFVRVIMVNLV